MRIRRVRRITFRDVIKTWSVRKEYCGAVLAQSPIDLITFISFISNGADDRKYKLFSGDIMEILNFMDE
ncbi:MAG: hypothetical protein ACTSVC_14705 [Promethearchaeota archaeon]